MWAIHEAGGVVLVQSAETAKFDGMPKSALETGVADLALPAEEMPAMLLRYLDHPLSKSLPLPVAAKAVAENIAHELTSSCNEGHTLRRPRLGVVAAEGLGRPPRFIAGSTMRFWAGYRDPSFWTQPGFLRLRLARDHVGRLAAAAGVGMIVGGPVLGLMVAIAPPRQLGEALLIGGALIFAIGLLAFLWRDLAVVTVSLEGRGIRRKTKPFLFNHFGFRNRDESWDYQGISGCGIVPHATLRARYSILVIKTAEGMTAFGIPDCVDEQKVAAILTASGIKVQSLERIPQQAVPAKSVGRKGFIQAIVLSVIGLLTVAGGGVGRLAIHGRSRVDLATIRKLMADVPVSAPVRQLEVVGDGGVWRAAVSPDGRWIWAVTETTGKHLVWNDRQDQPVGELAISRSNPSIAAFTPDSRQIVVVADGETHVWQLDPLKSLSKFSLTPQPDAVAVSMDGKRLAVASSGALRLCEIDGGKVLGQFDLPRNPIITGTLSADGQAMILVRQSGVISVRLSDGAVEEVIAYPKPRAAYFFGSVAAGGRWAAMAAPGQGVDLFDLAGKQKEATIATGAGTSAPAVSPDGSLVVAAYTNGLGLWDTKSGNPVARFEAHSQPSIAISDNGARLMGYGNRAPKVTLWDLPK